MSGREPSNNLLESMKLARPCDKDWDSMPGDDRIRFCSGCAKNVYNISDMTTDEARSFLAARGVTECMRLFRRADGTVINDNCPRVLRKIRNAARLLTRSVAAIVGVLLSCSVGYAQTAETEPSGKSSVDLLSLFNSDNDGRSVTASPIPPIVTGVVGDMGEFRAFDFDGRKRFYDWEVALAIRNKEFGSKNTTYDYLLQESVFDSPVNDLKEIIVEAGAKQNDSDHGTIDFALCLMVRNEEGDKAKARELLERVVRKSPRDTNAGYALAVLDELEGRTEGAALRYWDLYQMDPTFKESMVNLFNLYLREGKKEKAKQVIEELLKTMGPYSVRDLLRGDLQRLDKSMWPRELSPPPIIEPGFHGSLYP